MLDGMRPRSSLSLAMRALLVLPVFLVAACAPTVGTRAANCDEAAAREVVYRLDGTAYYLGQALISQGCSVNGAFCHSGAGV